MKKALIGVYLLVACIVVLQIGMNCYVSSSLDKVNRRLEDFKKLVVRLSPETEKVIAATYERSATQTVEAVERRIGSDVCEPLRKSMHEVNDLLTKKVTDVGAVLNLCDLESLFSGVRTSISNGIDTTAAQIANIDAGLRTSISNGIDTVRHDISSPAKANAERISVLLDLARDTSFSDEERERFFMAALAGASKKEKIVAEYVEWKFAGLEEAIKKGDEECLTSIRGACAEALEMLLTGSSEDICSFRKLRKRINHIDTAIVSVRSRQEAMSEEKGKDLSTRVGNASTAEDIAALEEQVETAETAGEIDADTADELLEKLGHKKLSVATAAMPLIVPTDFTGLPWSTWLKLVVARMNNLSVPLETRGAELSNAARAIAEAEKLEDEDVKEQLELLKKAIHAMGVEKWRETAQNVIKSFGEKGDKAKCSIAANELLAEVMSFDDESVNSLSEEVVRLHECLICEAVGEFKTTQKQIMDIEQDVSRESFMQLVGGQQHQALQLVLRIKGLEKKFPGRFGDELASANQRVEALELLVSGYRDSRTADEKQKILDEREQYRNWAERTISEAKGYYERAESLAGAWSKTTSSEDCQDLYKAAWYTLIVIYPDDLRSVDPVLATNWEELKNKIDNRWDKDNRPDFRINYKRIGDL